MAGLPIRQRRSTAGQVASLFWVAFLVTVPAWAIEPPPSPPTMLGDAELSSVFFLDADFGWAVGDRGVIWKTTDGGRAWKLQNSPTTCRLEDIHFIDAEIGWAVGGHTHGYTHQSSGVVLRTRDGGRTWTPVPNLLLPALKHVKFFDARHGWVAGDGSHLYPSGVFFTDDGGKTWTPAARGTTTGWTAADFATPQNGAVAGRSGELSIVAMNGVRPSRTQSAGERYVRQLELTGESGGWLVGDGGLVMTTHDSGFTWEAPSAPLPIIAQQHFDFHALSVHGEHVWIAGAPGTLVFHSADAGKTWQSFPTDHSMPIGDLTFIDENRGWAVGALGTILVTRDGGRTWRKQRTGGARTALLGIFSEPERVPLEVFAQQAGNEGFLTSIEILGRKDTQPLAPAAPALRDRTREAVSLVGGAYSDTAWRFPLPQAGLAVTTQSVLNEWNQATDGQAAQLLEEHLVRRIRQWRPSVIVTEDVSPRGDDPLAHLTNQLVLAAVQKAADETSYAEQITQVGLQPWKVQKVFSVVAGEKQGVVNVTPSQWAPRLGRSLEEAAELGRGMLLSELSPAPRNVGLSLLIDHLPHDTGRRDVFSGINLQAGGEARRELANVSAVDLDALSRASQKRHNVQQLVLRIKGDDPTAAAWLSQVNQLTSGISDRSAGEILYQLAQRYHRTGQSPAAAEALQLLMERYPQHPLADAAALWLVQYYASSETAWREKQGTKYVVGVAAHTPLEQSAPPDGEQAGAQPPVPFAAQSQIQTAGSISTASANGSAAQRSGRAVALARLIERTRPQIYADPSLKFSLAAALKFQGEDRQAERLFQQASNTKDKHKPLHAWAECAAVDEWLNNTKKNPPKKVFSCVTAPEKPRLDGRLDDTLWQLTRPVSLVSPRGDDREWPASVATAFDDDCLYFAISCRKAPGLSYSRDDQPRTRDADLSASDRVELHLDLDRDYASYYTIAIDSRGWTSDRCFGDPTWDPTYYVAASGDDEYWTAEVAIPWSQLGPKVPDVRDAWAIGIQRAAAHVGFQSFTQPASVVVQPEGFGLLVFE